MSPEIIPVKWCEDCGGSGENIEIVCCNQPYESDVAPVCCGQYYEPGELPCDTCKGAGFVELK